VTIYLVRHAESEAVAHHLLTGRLPSVPLTEKGVAQARLIGRVLSRLQPDAIYASPLERTMATAAPLARRLGLPVQPEPDLIEIEFGEWSGRSFDELAPDPEWRVFNTRPADARIPGGERIDDVAARATRALRRLADRHPNQRVAVFSHGDVIRLALAQLLGMPLNAFRSLIVEPAACAELRLDPASIALVMPNACRTRQASSHRHSHPSPSSSPGTSSVRRPAPVEEPRCTQP
jgi:probable phosphoglycerate mutase